MARIFARDAALKVAQDGLRWVIGADGVSEGDVAALEASSGLSAVLRAQAGQLADMDYIADVIYGRVKKEAEQPVLV